MNCVIIGNGYLGKKIATALNGHVVLRRITKQEDANRIMIDFKPTHVINCAGKTGTPNIDWCEFNKNTTFFGNVVLPTFILNACLQYGAKMIHIGSGCTYQGCRGYNCTLQECEDSYGFTEEEAPNFCASYYSWTKVVSEKFLKDFDVLQLRIRMPLSEEKHPRNLLTKLLNYNKILKAKNSITYIPDMLIALKKLIEKNATGIYNVVNPGSLNHEDILKVYERISGNKLKYETFYPDQLTKVVVAPRSNCVLSCRKLESIGITMPNSMDSVKKCVEQYLATFG